MNSRNSYQSLALIVLIFTEAAIQRQTPSEITGLHSILSKAYAYLWTRVNGQPCASLALMFRGILTSFSLNIHRQRRVSSALNLLLHSYFISPAPAGFFSITNNVSESGVDLSLGLHRRRGL